MHGCYAYVEEAALRILPDVPAKAGFDKVDLLRAIIGQESNSGEPDLVSETGAKGCGQITGKALTDVMAEYPKLRGVWQWNDARINVHVSAIYLRNRLRMAGNYWQAVRHYYGCGVDRLPGHPQSCDQYAAEVWGRAKLYYQARQQPITIASGE